MKSNVELFVDGRLVGAFNYDPSRNRLAYTPGANLAFGSHTVRVVARDAAGNVASRGWGFRVIR